MGCLGFPFASLGRTGTAVHRCCPELCPQLSALTLIAKAFLLHITFTFSDLPRVQGLALLDALHKDNQAPQVDELKEQDLFNTPIPDELKLIADFNPIDQPENIPLISKEQNHDPSFKPEVQNPKNVFIPNECDTDSVPIPKNVVLIQHDHDLCGSVSSPSQPENNAACSEGEQVEQVEASSWPGSHDHHGSHDRKSHDRKSCDSTQDGRLPCDPAHPDLTSYNFQPNRIMGGLPEVTRSQSFQTVVDYPNVTQLSSVISEFPLLLTPISTSTGQHGGSTICPPKARHAPETPALSGHMTTNPIALEANVQAGYLEATNLVGIELPSTQSATNEPPTQLPTNQPKQPPTQLPTQPPTQLPTQLPTNQLPTNQLSTQLPTNQLPTNQLSTQLPTNQPTNQLSPNQLSPNQLSTQPPTLKPKDQDSITEKHYFHLCMVESGAVGLRFKSYQQLTKHYEQQHPGCSPEFNKDSAAPMETRVATSNSLATNFMATGSMTTNMMVSAFSLLTSRPNTKSSTGNIIETENYEQVDRKRKIPSTTDPEIINVEKAIKSKRHKTEKMSPLFEDEETTPVIKKEIPSGLDQATVLEQARIDDSDETVHRVVRKRKNPTTTNLNNPKIHSEMLKMSCTGGDKEAPLVIKKEKVSGEGEIVNKGETKLKEDTNVEKNELKCPECKTVFKSKSTMNRHVGKAHGRLCQYCPMRFQLSWELELHYLKQHDKEHNKPGKPLTLITCDVCGRVSKGQNNHSTHMRIHQEKTLKCEKCSLMFYAKSQLVYHMKVKHSPDLLVYDQECTICKTKFASAHRLKCHVRKLHKEHKCDYCKDTFIGAPAFEAHLHKKHMDQATQKCSKCIRSYFTANQLRNHNNDCHALRTCAHCGVKVEGIYALHRHEREEHNIGKCKKTSDRCYIEECDWQENRQTSQRLNKHLFQVRFLSFCHQFLIR